MLEKIDKNFNRWMYTLVHTYKLQVSQYWPLIGWMKLNIAKYYESINVLQNYLSNFYQPAENDFPVKIESNLADN